ncbi:hypothetical protein AB0G04_40925 [Actinoplanes sp. NPDC023801]|uniref:hypothetical protein n=1 Tax=Actinoplanes sp. NPDC023801 TaxID=3154595 RepID=UPI0033C0ED31
MKNRRTLKKVIAVLMVGAATTAVQVATNSPASAHDASGVVWTSGPGPLPWNVAARGRVTNNYTRVWAEDAKADNLPAHVFYRYWNSGSLVTSVVTDTSSSGGAVSTGAPGTVHSFQVCVGNSNMTCSGWYSA